MVHKYTYLNEVSLNTLPLRILASISPSKRVLATEDPGPLVRRHAVEGLIQSIVAIPW